MVRGILRDRAFAAISREISSMGSGDVALHKPLGRNVERGLWRNQIDKDPEPSDLLRCVGVTVGGV